MPSSALPFPDAATVHGRLVVVGAGGFGREVLDIVEAMNHAGSTLELVGAVDDSDATAHLLARRGVAHLGPIAALIETRGRFGQTSGHPCAVAIGIGAGETRRLIDATLTDAGLHSAVLVHPMATVGADNRLAEGSILAAGARITTNVSLGRHAHLHVNSTVGHDSTLGDFVSVYPGATVSGSVLLGDGVTIGTGANVLPGLTIGERAFVGAGAVVIDDVEPLQTVAGVPARPVRAHTNRSRR